MKTISILIDTNGNRFFCVSFPYEETIINSIRKIPSSKFDKKLKMWLIRVDHIVYKYIHVFSKYFDFKISEDALLVLEELNRIPSETDIMPELKLELREFQKIGVSMASKFERCLIADDMGVGKTAQSIATVEKNLAYPCIVVCPASLKLNWQKEINMWVNRTVLIVNGESPLEKYDSEFIIINYDIIEKHLHLLKRIPFGSIILDESHLLKNHKTKRSKSIKELSRNIRFRLALTGTPILNKAKELLSLLDIIDRLDAFGGFWQFAKKYCGAIETDYGWSFNQSTNMEELNSNLKSVCMIRRLKSDVLPELPPKQRSEIPIEIENREEYESASKNFKRWLKTKISPEEYSKEILKSENLTESQKKFLIDCKVKNQLNKSLSAEALVKMEYLKQLTVKGKLNRIKDIINNIVDNGNKLVVFAIHKNIQQSLYKEYKDISAKVFSEDNIEVRQENINKFQTDESCKLIIVSLKAAGIGITLTAANSVLFAEFGFTPAEHDQAEDRCFRIGQKNSVNCYYVYGENTIEQYILEIINSKRTISDAIVDGKIEPHQEETMDELINKFIN